MYQCRTLYEELKTASKKCFAELRCTESTFRENVKRIGARLRPELSGPGPQRIQIPSCCTL